MQLILIFAGEDEEAAKELLRNYRARDMGGALRSAFFFEPEDCARAVIMPDVPEHHARKIMDAYQNGVCERRRYPEDTPNVVPLRPGSSQELQQAEQLTQFRVARPVEVPQSIKRRGRPPGSKNRPKPL